MTTEPQTKSPAVLEHANVTVTDPDVTASLLCDLFDWEVRWSGGALAGGRSVHVGEAGNGETYLAVYTGDGTSGSHTRRPVPGSLNHIGVVVADLDAVEAKVISAGLLPHSHDDYDPGRRFYFDDTDGIEYEVVSYTS